MMFLIAAVLALLAALIYYLSKPLRERSLYPPGPIPLPLLGNVLLFRGSKRALFDESLDVGEKYGDGNAVTIWFGLSPNIIINTFQGVKEAFIDNQHDFASRPDMKSLTDTFFAGTPDIIFGEYTARWQAMKKLGAKVIRRVMDANRLEANVIEATDKMVAALRDQDLSKPIEIQKYSTNCVFNILAALCFGVSYDMNDPKFLELLELRRRGNELPTSVFLLMMIPGLNRSPKLLHMFPQWRGMVETNRAEMDFMQEYIDEHRRTRSERLGTDEELRDILDAIHTEQEEGAKTGQDVSVLTDSAAKMIIFDIFMAGTETTSTTLRWFVLEMALHPEIQEACADQIQSVIGNSTPSLDDRPLLPLVEAALCETLRLHPAAPLAVQHAPTAPDSMLFGKYPVKKDAVLSYNVWAIHRDPDLFPDPLAFDPARYIEDGKVYRPNGWIPFGVGRRVCLGETLAKNDMFLVCTGLLQRLRFKTAPTEDYTTYPDVISGLTNIPKSGQKFIIELR